MNCLRMRMIGMTLKPSWQSEFVTAFSTSSLKQVIVQTSMDQFELPKTIGYYNRGEL
jgi:hypothetical protein